MTEHVAMADRPARPQSSRRGCTQRTFGVDTSGHEVELTTLRNDSGAEVSFLSLGGIVQSIRMPDRDGMLGDVVLGFDDLGGYLSDTHYVGALIGRYANRIAFARYVADNGGVQLDANEPPHHLHGGAHGFHRQHWRVETFTTTAAVGARLSLESPAGDQGYPGTLSVSVTYTLSDDNTFAIEYVATTTAPTPINLTHHAYFNLAASATTVLEHTLQVYATRYLPVDRTLIPSGVLELVADTPFDFTAAIPIGARLAVDAVPHEQLALARGFDHCFVVAAQGTSLARAARLHDGASGRTLEVHTTEPGLQVFTGNAFDGSQRSRNGRMLAQHAGIALETQHFPDSPNQADFPSTMLSPGDRYRSRTEYRFTVSA